MDERTRFVRASFTLVSAADWTDTGQISANRLGLNEILHIGHLLQLNSV